MIERECGNALRRKNGLQRGLNSRAATDRSISMKVQSLLRAELERRKKRNSTYSLRALARDTALSPSFLSCLLNGKRRVSVDQAVEIADRLGWGTKATKIFVAAARVETAKTGKSRRFAEKEQHFAEDKHRDFDRLRVDQFATIADWYHTAILELSDINGFVSSPAWVAKRLSITEAQATAAIDRLLRLKLLAVDERGVYVKQKNCAVADAPSQAIRQFHRQHLKNAERAIEKFSFEERHISGITMSVDPANWEKATAMIRDFRSQLCAMMESGDRSRVYHLGLQLFPLDHPSTERGPR